MFPVPSLNPAGHRHFQPSAQQVRGSSSGFQLVADCGAFPAQGCAADPDKREQVFRQRVQRSDRAGGCDIKLFPVSGIPGAFLGPCMYRTGP